LSRGEILEIAEYAKSLEKHYGKPQDIEFAVEMNKMYILQSRPITTVHKEIEDDKELSGTVLLEGLGASPGVGIGVVRIIREMSELEKIKKGDVLVTEMTNPDMVVGMQKSVAIVTDEGGLTSHASIVSREMGIPCIVGTGEATSKLKDGMKITVDGRNGKVYEGEVGESSVAEVKEAVKTEKVNLKVIVDLPEYAERAARSKVDSVGLMRLEGVIASFSKHPLYYEKHEKLDEYSGLLSEGIGKIMKHFRKMWIRASDIRTDEFSSLEGSPEREINPMLGFHGVRFSLKHPEILKAELNAIRDVAVKNPEKKIGIMFPQIISIEEVRKCKEYFEEIKTENMEFGVMIETPASVQIIEEICDEVQFISFGTNDLTQFTLAVDRGEDNVQYLYNELHPAIFSQIRHVIKVCKRKNVESSICGQAGSKSEMVKFLVNEGIDSISVNADAALDISNLINEIANRVGSRVEENVGSNEKDSVGVVENVDEVKVVEEVISNSESNVLDKSVDEPKKEIGDQNFSKEMGEAKKELRPIKGGQVLEVEVEDVNKINKTEEIGEMDLDELRRERKRLRNRERRKKKKEKMKKMKAEGKWDKKGGMDLEFGKNIKKDENIELEMKDEEIVVEEKSDQNLLDDNKIEFMAERSGIDGDDLEHNIGPIEPFNDLSRIEREGEEIQDRVDKDNESKIEENKRLADKVETNLEISDVEGEKENNLMGELREVLDRSEGKNFEGKVEDNIDKNKAVVEENAADNESNDGKNEDKDVEEDNNEKNSGDDGRYGEEDDLEKESVGVYKPEEVVEQKREDNKYKYDFDDF
jgi:phosphoenolpyruvate-protein kinase (PTS system EI component)